MISEPFDLFFSLNLTIIEVDNDEHLLNFLSLKELEFDGFCMRVFASQDFGDWIERKRTGGV